MNFKLVSALAAIGLVCAAPAMSSTLDFENIPTQSVVDQYYNGGLSVGSPAVTGPNYGITFDGLAVVLSNEDPGSPLFDPTDSRLGLGILAPGAGATLNSALGFSSVSFLYSSLGAGSVTVWSGLHGGGTALYTFNLLANSQGDGSVLSNWDSLSASLLGVGHSITFGDALAGFDNVAVSEVPLPAAAWLLMSGLGGLGGFVRRRRAAAAVAA